MSDYVYRDLLKEGYLKIKLTPNEHKEIFRSYNKRVKYEVYEDKNTFIRERYTPSWVKIINIILYPILLLIHGIGNIKELNEDIQCLFNEKQGGHFIKDYIYKSDLRKRNINYTDKYLK